jgi:hypothetical protein
MARDEKRRYEADDDDIDQLIRRKKKTGASSGALVVIGIITAVLLLACLLGVGIVAVISLTQGTQPDEFVGSWKARWTFGGMDFNSIYTFNKDGTLREEQFDLQGNPRDISDARWCFRNGQIEIDWENGSWDHATVRHIDAKTMDYRIVDHTDQIQIGVGVTFRRQ